MAELIPRNARPIGGPAAAVLVRDGVIARISRGRVIARNGQCVL